MEFKSPYKQLDRKVNTWCKYTKRLDTYGLGCEHHCQYCYAKSLLEFRNKWGVVSCPANMRDIIKSIYDLKRSDVVRLGVMTDCFAPIEIQHKNTFRTIQLLNNHKINYLIVTKSDLVADDLYMNIYDNSLAHIQITITATKDIEFEQAPCFDKRIKAVEKLYKNGFDVSVRLSPYLPEYVDVNVINDIECNKILIEFLKVSPFVRKAFDIDYSQYSLSYGGMMNLPLQYKINLVSKISNYDQISVGEYVYYHYLYFRDNVNYNKTDCCNLSLNIYKEPQLKLF